MKTLKPEELRHAVKTLALLVLRGYPLSQALQQLDQTHPVWVEVGAAVRSGDTAAQALKRYPHVFSEFFGGMVQSAERAPKGEVILDDLSTWLEVGEEVRRKLRELLYYPSILISFLLLELAILVGFALPTSVLPFVFINNLQALEQLEFALAACSYVLVLLAALSSLTSWKIEWVLPIALKIPAFRALALRADQALWARAMACYLQGGATLLDSLKACSGIVWSSELERELETLPQCLSKGDTLSQAISNLDLIEPSLRWSITAGESKEDLSATLFYAAEQLESNLLSQTRAFFFFLQPCAVAVVGLLTALVLGSFWWGFYHYSWNLTV